LDNLNGLNLTQLILVPVLILQRVIQRRGQLVTVYTVGDRTSERISGVDGITTMRNHSTRRKIWLSASLSTTNPIRTGLGSKLGPLRGDPWAY